MSDFFDRPVSFIHALSVGFWIVGAVLIAGDLFLRWGTSEAGLFVAGVGATLTVRGYLCHLHEREMNAFELGRQSADLKVVR